MYEVGTQASSGVIIAANKVRCRNWPRCFDGSSCPYHHPEVICPFYPNCPEGDECEYIHTHRHKGRRLSIEGDSVHRAVQTNPPPNTPDASASPDKTLTVNKGKALLEKLENVASGLSTERIRTERMEREESERDMQIRVYGLKKMMLADIN